jgi:2-polyprenyl-6-methoxyphenol hydroxylase-like FAD-dependent oxidoreductase
MIKRRKPMMLLKPSVLIVGAGPTGIFLAYALTRMGVGVRIIDGKSAPTQHSRAMGVHARTLEFYQQFGIADNALELGTIARDVHINVEGKAAVQFSLTDMGGHQSRFPFLLSLAQDVHERFLIGLLADLGVQIEWATSLVGLTQTPDHVSAQIESNNKVVETNDFEWLVGCDGASSTTRHALGIGFTGGTTQGTFYVADVDTSVDDDDIHAGIGAETFALLMPVRTTGTKRIVGVVNEALATKPDISFWDVAPVAIALLGISVSDVHWFSVYKTHHRVADRFQKGRCFLAGDAGHIHSPIGGQGMNTGLGDAMNLAWKLAQVCKGQAHAKLLDSYEPERIAYARTLVSHSDRAFNVIMGMSALIRFARRYLAAPAIWLATRTGLAKTVLFKTVSQIHIHYRTSPLSRGTDEVIKGQVSAGDRLPFIAEVENDAPLAGLTWQIHVYGKVLSSLAETASGLGLALHSFDLAPANVKKLGLLPNAAYLVRPDGHIGLILHNQSPHELTRYASSLGLVFNGA